MSTTNDKIAVLELTLKALDHVREDPVQVLVFHPTRAELSYLAVLAEDSPLALGFIYDPNFSHVRILRIPQHSRQGRLLHRPTGA